MRTRKLFPFFILAMMVAAASAPPRAQEKPAEKPAKKEMPPQKNKDGKKLLTALDTLKIAGVGGPRLSPDGASVAYTVSEIQMEKDKEWKSVTHLWVVPAAGPASAARQFTRGEKGATNPAWSPDGKMIAFRTNREKDSEQQVWMMMADGGEAWQVTTHKGGVGNFWFSPDGKKLLLTTTDQPGKEEEARKKDKDDTILIDQDIKMTLLWLWDIEKKEGKRLTEGNWTVSDPRWSLDGTRISYTINPTPKADDGGLSDIWILTVATGEKKKLVENAGSDQSARWSPDGKWIAYTANADSGGVAQSHLMVVSAEGGTPRKLTGAFAYDARAPTWSPDGKTLYFSSNTLEAIEIFAADVAGATVKQLTSRGGVTSFSELSADGRVIVGTMSGPGRPVELYRASVGFTSFEPLSDHNGWVKEYALGAVEIAKWKSKDGTEIEGVLTEPVDLDPSKKYPFIVNPHGGPTGASLMGFNSTSQLFAANGYLMLEPNFRGSTGKGEKFAQANKNTWGIDDYEDCMSGVQAMVDRGWADPQRLGAWGWSYGGYMTYWMLTQTDIV